MTARMPYKLTIARIATVCSAVATVMILAASTAGLLDGLSKTLSDPRFQLAARDPSGSIVLVEIDSRSLAAVGHWPWTRAIHAAVIDKLTLLGASDIAFDVDFSANADGDGELEAALNRAGDTVILAAFRQRTARPAELVVTHPLPRFLDHAWEASVEVEPDVDGRVRSMGRASPFGATPVPSLAAVLGRSPSGDAKPFRVDFGIDARRIDRLSVADLLDDKVADARIRGKAVIVGASAIELRDFFDVPRFGIVPGALLQALAAESLRQGRDLQPMQRTFTPLWLSAALLLGCLVRGRFALSSTLLLGAAAAIALETCALLVQARWPYIVDTAPMQVQFAAFAAIAVAAEIEERRLKIVAAQRSARRTQRLLDRVILDNFAGIVVIDADGIVQAASQAAAELLGMPVPRIVGRTAAAVLPTPLSSEIEHALQETRRSGWTAQGHRHAEIETPRRGRLFVDYVVTISQLPSGPAPRSTLLEDESALCLTFLDVTERRNAEARLTYLAHHDDLTGLLNRYAFAEHLSRALAAEPDTPVLRIDLDRFSLLNSRLGQVGGDTILQAMAATLRRLAPDGAAVARLGADEFAIVDSANLASLTELGQAVVRETSRLRIDGTQIAISVSCGIASQVVGDQGIDAVLQRADAAIQAAKAAGGGRLKLYDAGLNAAIEDAKALELDLAPALINGEFEVVYQRQIDARHEHIVGVEALLRWNHPLRGSVPPAAFIPVAERSGFIEPLGAWVLETACREVASWPMPVKLAVNVSAIQFSRGDLVRTVEQTLVASGLPAAQLDLELTETLLVDDDGLALDLLHQIRGLGIGLAIDDFGTGYSSLAYLRRFPITKIKIDRSFVQDLGLNEASTAIVDAVLKLGRSLGMRTNVEGVETVEQLAVLRQLGCDEVQGYLHGRPERGAVIADSLGKFPGIAVSTGLRSARH